MNLAHVHLILNHIPVVGTLFGLTLLTAAYITRSPVLRTAALVTFVIVALSAVGVFLTGEPAEEIVEGIPGVVKSVVEQHEAAGKVALIGALALGAVSLFALAAARKPGALQSFAGTAVLAVSIGAMALMAWTANLGGQIRHPEIASAGSVIGEQQDERENAAHEREEHD
jgi:hypothetical protein